MNDGLFEMKKGTKERKLQLGVNAYPLYNMDFFMPCVGVYACELENYTYTMLFFQV